MASNKRIIIYASSLVGGLVLALFLAQYNQVTALDTYDFHKERLDSLDILLQDLLPSLLSHKPSNANGSEAHFANFELSDHESDSGFFKNTEELIKMAGFESKSYKVTAKDGYINKLIRVINPLANRRLLKWPPVILFHGGTIDTSCFVMSSTKRHHPERYPRTLFDKPITSWNRSLAFVLANNGYDVWLPAARGSTHLEADHVKLRKFGDKGIGFRPKVKSAAFEFKLIKELAAINYWNFTEDDIIANEIKPQINAVLKLASKDWPSAKWRQSPKASILGFSLSAPVVLGFVASEPEYVDKRINSMILLGPTVSNRGFKPLTKLILSIICPLVPTDLGQFFVNTFSSQPFHLLTAEVSKSKSIRYTVYKAIAGLLYGPSPKYESLIERNLIGHLLRSFGFKEAKQFCQQLRSDKLRFYDYGPWKNEQVYGQATAPEYDLSNTRLRKWAIITGENDMLGGPEVVERLKQEVHPPPSYVTIAPKFDHFDIVAGVENGRYINLPILDFLNSVSFDPRNKMLGNGFI